MTDDHRCEAFHDADGTFLGHARVSPDLDERGRAAMVALIKAATRKFEADCAADPTIGERQAAAIKRIRARGRRWRGETP